MTSALPWRSGSVAALVKSLGDVGCLAIITVVTLGVGVLNQSFTGFPKGYDAYGHLSKIKLLVDYFPNVDWNSEWYSGQLYSEGSFPALFHYFGALLVGLFGVSPPSALIAIAAASYLVTGWGLYGLVRVASGNRAAALLAALLLLSSSGFWIYIVEGGLYPRILGMAFLALFGFLVTLYVKRRSRLVYVATVLALAATLSSHLLVGAIGVAFGLLMIAAFPMPLTQKVRELAKLLIPTGLVVSYFYVPYALTLMKPGPLPLLTREYTAIPVSALVEPGQPGGQFESLPFFLVPLAVALTIASIVMMHRRTRLPVYALGAVVGIAALASLVYAFVGLPVPGLFLYAFQPGQALFFASWFLAAFIGLTLSQLKLPRWVGLALVMVLVSYTFVTSQDVVRGEYNGDNAVKRQVESALTVDPSERQYRVGVSWDGGSDWIGSQSDIPQTRGYQQQGVLHADWQYWLEQAVWSPRPNYAETSFLLNWYAVKTLYGGPDPAVVSRFEARPDLYTPLTPGLPASARTFQYINPSPILSARSTSTALVIGSYSSYALILRAIALSGLDSNSLIPIRGGDYVDDHSAADLAQFSQVILYGFKVHDELRAMALIASYVRQGGSVLIEANNSPFEVTSSAPDPIPGGQVVKTGIGPSWNFDNVPGPITDNVDFNSFAAATYNGGPWGVSYIPVAQLKSWAQPVLFSGGRPVVVAGALGAGRVVWSGLNLPFHSVINQAIEESRLLAQEIAWAAPDHGGSASYSTNFVNPQLRRIVVSSPAAGVLFKENWFADWHASVNGTAAQVFRAGPDFMYVPLESSVTYPVQLEFAFTRSLLEWSSDGISVLAVIGLVAYFAAGVISRRRPRRWTRTKTHR